MWRICLLIAVSVCLAGCAVTSLDGQRMPARSEAFAAYVEAVFRRQNRVAADLALALEREVFGSERFASLEAAEFRLQSDCSSLNEIARAQRDGERVGGPGALRQARTAPECERATDHAASLL